MAPKASKSGNSRSKREWNIEEELLLIQCLKEIIANGWKSENGWRPNYYNELERLMAIKLPNCGLRATPNISSKLKRWKTAYGYVYDFLGMSGMSSLNHETHLIVAEDHLWTWLEQKHKEKYKWLKDKKFPYYDDWCEIFGKDRADGCMARASNEEDIEDFAPIQNAENDGYSPRHTFCSVQESFSETSSQVHVEKTSAERPSKAGKRKFVDDCDSMLTNLQEEMRLAREETNKSIRDAAALLGAENEQRNTAGEIISALPLSILQKVQISRKVLGDPATLDVFVRCSDPKRVDLVAKLLE